jgi:hypothetical protein
MHLYARTQAAKHQAVEGLAAPMGVKTNECD